MQALFKNFLNLDRKEANGKNGLLFRGAYDMIDKEKKAKKRCFFVKRRGIGECMMWRSSAAA